MSQESRSGHSMHLQVGERGAEQDTPGLGGVGRAGVGGKQEVCLGPEGRDSSCNHPVMGPDGAEFSERPCRA